MQLQSQSQIVEQPQTLLDGKQVTRQKTSTSSWRVALVVWAVYGLWLLTMFRGGYQARDFIFLGTNFINQSQTSQVIKIDPTFHYMEDGIGYDGQFCYYMGLDPLHARYYMDDPNYRYSRILYPLLATALAFGQPDLLPYTLLLINWLALGAGTWAVAAWLKRKNLSPWFALVYGFYPGLFIALQRDLTEILGYSLVAWAIYLFDYAPKRRILWSGLVFALAVLARESTALFAVFYAISLLFIGDKTVGWRTLWAGNWRKAATLIALALTPFLIYKVVLWVWLGTYGLGAGERFPLLPFGGLLHNLPWGDQHILQITTVIFPAMICLGTALWALSKGVRYVEIWLLLANICLFVIWLPYSSYWYVFGSARIATGVVLGALYCLPYLDIATRRNRSWFWASTALWFSLLATIISLV